MHWQIQGWGAKIAGADTGGRDAEIAGADTGVGRCAFSQPKLALCLTVYYPPPPFYKIVIIRWGAGNLAPHPN